MNGTRTRNGMGWSTRLLVGFVLILAGAAAAVWGLAHYQPAVRDRKSTRLNSSQRTISYAVFCLKKKKRAAIVAFQDIGVREITILFASGTVVSNLRFRALVFLTLLGTCVVLYLVLWLQMVQRFF